MVVRMKHFMSIATFQDGGSPTQMVDIGCMSLIHILPRDTATRAKLQRSRGFGE